MQLFADSLAPWNDLWTAVLWLISLRFISVRLATTLAFFVNLLLRNLQFWIFSRIYMGVMGIIRALGLAIVPIDIAPGRKWRFVGRKVENSRAIRLKCIDVFRLLLFVLLNKRELPELLVLLLSVQPFVYGIWFHWFNWFGHPFSTLALYASALSSALTSYAHGSDLWWLLLLGLLGEECLDEFVGDLVQLLISETSHVLLEWLR